MTAPPTTVRFTRKIRQLLQEAAAAHGKSISEVVNDCVTMALPRLHPFYKQEAAVGQEYEGRLFEIRQAMRAHFLREDEADKDAEETTPEEEASEAYRQLRDHLRGPPDGIAAEQVNAALAILNGLDPAPRDALLKRLSSVDRRKLGLGRLSPADLRKPADQDAGRQPGE